MNYITIVDTLGRYWQTAKSNNKEEVAELMGSISSNGCFATEEAFVYVNPKHIVSMELVSKE